MQKKKKKRKEEEEEKYIVIIKNKNKVFLLIDLKEILNLIKLIYVFGKSTYINLSGWIERTSSTQFK